MYKRLDKYLNMKNILCPSQYGFRQQHSAQHAILDIVNKIQTNMDNKLYSCGIFIDLKKAFDTVDHDILLGKLSHYGIRGVVNDWFSSYLKHRSQTTLIGNCVSDSLRCRRFMRGEERGENTQAKGGKGRKRLL